MHLLTTLVRKANVYRRVYGWLLIDLVQRQGGAVLIALGLACIGVGSRFAAVGAVLLFVHAQERGTRPVVLGIELPASASAHDLALWAVGVGALAGLTAAATYLAEAQIFRCAQRYAQRTIERILAIIMRRGGWRLPGTAGVDELSAVRGLVSRGSVMLLRGTLILLRVMIPLITLLVAVATLLIIQLPLSVIVLCVFALYLIPFYLVNLRVVRASRGRESHTKALSRELRSVLPFVLGRSFAGGQTLQDSGDVAHALPLQRTWSSLRHILLARKRVAFLQDIFFGIVLVTSLVVFAVFVADSAKSWALFLGYLIALRFASSSMSSVASMLTTTNRFLPQVQRVTMFVRVNEARVDEPGSIAAEATVRHRVQLTESAEAIAGSDAQLVLGPGMRIFCIDGDPPTPRTLRRWCRSLAGGSRAGDALWSSCSMVGWIARVPSLTPVPSDVEGAEGAAQRSPVDGPRAHVQSLLAPTLRSAGGVLVIDARLLTANLAQDARREVLQALQSHCVILLGGPRELSALDADLLDAGLIAEGGAVHGIGSPQWLANEPAAAQLCARFEKAGDTLRARACDDDDEDEDEDEDDA